MDWLICPLLLVGFLSPATGFNQYEEAIWTRDTWREFKLIKSRHQWRVIDDPTVSSNNQILSDWGYDKISTIGPAPQILGDISGGDPILMSEWLKEAVGQTSAGGDELAPLCWNLVEAAWRSVTHDIENKLKLSVESIKWHFVDSCEAVSENIVKSHTLKKVDDSENRNAGFELKLRRDGKTPTEAEKEVVLYACNSLLQHWLGVMVETMEPFAWSYEGIVKVFRTENRRVMKREGGRDCHDNHEKCEMWADIGECQKNPNYMLIQCSLSCGVCPGADAYKRMGKLMLLPSQIRNLTETYINGKAEMLLATCAGDSGSHYLHLQPGELQVVRKPSNGKAHPILSKLDQGLVKILGDQCLYLNQGWWTYELCLFNGIIQAHFDRAGQMIDENSLGVFVSSHWGEVSGSQMSDFNMGNEAQPGLFQEYENGSECEKDGVLVRRKSSLWIACGPRLKEGMSMVVSEPYLCQYLFVVFSADMCKLDLGSRTAPEGHDEL